MIEAWQTFYQWHDPVIFSIGGLSLRWYGLMYVLALLSGYFAGRWLVKKDKLPITLEQYDMAFIYVEVGVVLGARLGYVAFYEEDPLWYFTQPWQIFNPFHEGQFVGISGLSYHGAIVGFLAGAWAFCRKYKVKFWLLMDLAVVASAAGYTFGRIGNFLNERLVGRPTEMPWGVITHGELRHPATLYEALLEGLLVFVILFFFRKYKSFEGQLAALYGMLYAAARFTAEFWRQPDPQLGFILWNWVTMGQLLSLGMFVVSALVYRMLRMRKVPA